MIGTLINVAAVIAGGVIGMLLGSRVSARLRETLMDGVGLVVVVLGVQMALKSDNSLLILLSLVIGGLLGEWLRLEEHLENLGNNLKQRVGASGSSRFTEGFMAASLLFCVGPMAILGAINDGLQGDYSILAIKSVLDGFSALAFASTMGVGVLFSALPVLVYQGAIALLASLAQTWLTDAMITAMTAAGGVIVLGIGLRMLNLKQVRVGSFLPALIVAPLLTFFF